MSKVDDLVNRIASGKATLLGVEDICGRLGISRSTFDRWVRNGGGKPTSHSGVNALAMLASRKASSAIAGFIDPIENMTDGAISFPPPDIRIGNSPKWELETFKTWLKANVVAGG